MIDYAVLCHAIADWRAGHAPAPAQYAVEPQTTDDYEEYVEEEEAAPSEEHTVIYNLPLIPVDDEG
ncbi:MAG: hypothetical protein R3B09_29450 [Nannocystaceae bacterium]